MAIRENIKDPLGILNNSDDNHPDPLGILKKKISGSELKTGSEKISPSPSPLKSHLTEEQTKQEIDYLNSPQGNKLKPFSDNTSNAPSHVAKEVANIEEKNRAAKISLIDESVKNSPNLESAISKINNVDLSKVSEARAGQTIYNTLHDPAFIERTQDDPKLAHDAAVIKNNLAITHPAFGLKMVEQKIGQHIQDSGKNSLWYEHPDEASMDSAVEDMVSNGKMTQQERVLYMKNKGLVKDWVKYQSPALVQSLRRGAESGLMGLESSIRDLSNKATGGILESAGLIENNEQRAERQTAEQDATPQIEPKTGTGKAVKGIGELTGFLAPMVLTTILTKGAGATGEAAEAIPMIAQFEGINADRSRQLFPGDTKTQLSYTLLGSTIDASLGKILPTGKAARNIISLLKKDAAEVAGKMTGDIAKDEALKKGLLDRVKSFVGETAENSAHTANAITGFQMLHNGLDAAFGKRDFNLEQEAADAVDTWKSAFVSGLPLAGIGAANKLMSQKIKGRITVDVAENPEKAIQTIEDHAKFNPELEAVKDEGIRKIQDVSKAWGVIKELPLSEAQKEKFLLKDQEQKALDKQAATANVDVVKEDLQNKANEAYADKVKLYNGTDTAPEHEQYQEKVKTPDEIEPELQNQLGEGKAKQAAKEINEIAEYDLWPEGLQSWEKESAKQYPLQFLKEVSDQLGTVDKVDEKTTASPRQTAESKYGKDIVKLAEEYFPNEKDKIPVPTEGEVPPVTEIGKIVEPTKEGGGGEVPPTTEQPVAVGSEGSKEGITHSATADTRGQLGLPEYEGRPVETHDELRAYAKKAIADDPAIADKTMTKIEKGGKVTNKDNAILAEYKAAIDYKLENNPSKETFEQAKRLINVLEPSGTELGKGLESRKLLSPKEDNLTNFLIDKQTAQGTELSDRQIVEQTEQFKEMKKAKDDLQAQLDIEIEKNKKLSAEKQLGKETKKTKRSEKKSKEDFVKEREQIWDHLKKKWDEGKGRTSATILPYADRLADIAPDIARLVKSHLEEGVTKLDDIASSIFEKAKDAIPEIRKSDIYDLIAGRYDVKKKTYNEITAEARLLKREAKLMDELAKARKGEESEKNERSRVEKSRRVDELEKQIKKVREQNKSKEEPEPVDDATSGNKSQEERLAAKKKELLNKIDKLNKDLKDKNFLKEKQEEPPLKLDNKTRKLMDRVIELERKRNIELDRDEYSKRSKLGKVYDKIMEVAGIRRIVQSAVDLSIPFRQGATLISARRIDTWVKSFGNMMKSAFNQKNYDRLMYGIRHSDNYHEMVKDGITFNDLDSIKPEQRNEDFQKSFIYKIPYLSAPLIASNRAADAFLNVARYDLYSKFSRNLERQGKTRQSDPKEYEDAAKWAMNMTGRGNLLKAAESGEAKKLLGNTFYGARLMASRFNMLNPATYVKMSPSMRLEAIKDITAWAATTMAVGYALTKVTGATISLNPDDSEFLQLRVGDKVYDMSGGMAIYLRTYLRIVNAAYKKVNPNVTKFEANKAVENAGKSTVKFFRNKLAPNTGYAADAFFGKPGGQKFDPLDVVKIYPMYVDDVKKALKEEGPIAFATVLLPNLLGVGYGNYATKGSIDTDLQTLLERNLRSDEVNKETIKNYKDAGRSITNKEFNEYVDKRDEKIKTDIEKMFNEGVLVIDNGKVVKKPYSELTKEQVVKETSSIKSKATKETKEELFGTHEKTREEKRAEKKLKKAKKQDED